MALTRIRVTILGTKETKTPGASSLARDLRTGDVAGVAWRLNLMFLKVLIGVLNKLEDSSGDSSGLLYPESS